MNTEEKITSLMDDLFDLPMERFKGIFDSATNKKDDMQRVQGAARLASRIVICAGRNPEEMLNCLVWAATNVVVLAAQNPVHAKQLSELIGRALVGNVQNQTGVFKRKAN